MINLKEKEAQIVDSAQIITVASIDEKGYPRPVPMVKLKNGQGEIFLSTALSSAKVAHFKVNPKAGVSIVRGNDSVVYTGEMKIISDQTIKSMLWGDWMLDHFPGGPEDPEYCIMKFIPESVTYWIDHVFVKDQKYMNLFCQSCGMPMQTSDQFGTKSDASLNEDFCCYCYKEGQFTSDCTMEEMIDHCIKFLDQYNESSDIQLSKEEAIERMQKYFPHLKRWAK